MNCNITQVNYIHMKNGKIEDKEQKPRDWYTEFKGEENE